MNWLTNYVLPKIRAFARKDVPDNLWKKCPGCEQMLFHRELAANFEVCRNCGHHFRIGSAARFKLLFDDGRTKTSRRRRSRPTRCAFATGSGTPSGCARPRRPRRRQRGGCARRRPHRRIPSVVAAFDFALHGRLDGGGGREALLAAARRAVELRGGADRRAGVRWGPHAGGHPILDADAAHDPCRQHGQGGGAALHRAVDRPDDRRRLRLLCDARRHHAGRARRHHRFRRGAGHRGDDPRETAGGLSARRIPL